MKNGQLQVLICSGNLGNAAPDDESLKLWLPDDGQCNTVMKYPANYPIRDQFSTFDDYYDDDKFDIIVVGMQEATFGASEEEAPPPTGGDSSYQPLGNGSNHRRKLMPVPKIGVGKALGNLSSYTASKNHIKKGNNKGPGGDATVGSNDGNEGFGVSVGLPEGWDQGTSILHEMMQTRLPSYTRIVSFQRGQMRLEIFALQKENVMQADVIYTKAQNTGRAGLANKGGIIAEISINGRTRLSFLTAHLEAHEGAAKYQARCSSLGDILGGAKPSTTLHDSSLTSHYCFVMGDLNFRTELPDFAQPGSDEEKHKKRIRKIVTSKDWERLNQADELNRALRVKDCLVGFQTLLCNFPPTFKVERAPGYDYIDKRRPSYTDRILWKNNHLMEHGIRPYVYEPIDDFKSSDHKPVRAAFGVTLNQPRFQRVKMARRRSAMQMAGDFLQNMSHNPSGHAMAHKERLYIFLADITVRLSAGMSSLPNPYVCIVTTPEEATRKSTKRWDRLKKKLPGFLRSNSARSDDWGTPIQRTSHGWPQSSVQKQTSQPLWDGEEFYTEIKTYDPDGTPLDLTGALMQFTVMDCKNSALVTGAFDNVLGSSSFNLGNLVSTFRPPGEAKTENPAQPARGRQRRGSILNLFRREDSSTSTAAPSSPSPGGQRRGRKAQGKQVGKPTVEEDPVKTIPIDAPLFKNGMETGRIRFTMDAWWLTESTAKAILGGDGSKSSSVNFNSMTSAVAAARAVGGRGKKGPDLIAEAPQSLGLDASSHTFSTRREVKNPKHQPPRPENGGRFGSPRRIRPGRKRSLK